MTPYEARVAGDKRVASSWEPVPGGVRFRTPEWPAVRDYNAVVLEPGAALVAPGDVPRVIAFDAAFAAPEGWQAMELSVLGYDGPAPSPPAEVREVGFDDLVSARRAVWRSLAVEGEGLRQLEAMQARQGEAGRLFAIGDSLGWAQMIEGFVDDVYVVEEARGQGLGRALTQAVMAAGGRFLSVEPGNAPAIALYGSLGFADAGTLLHLTRMAR